MLNSVNIVGRLTRDPELRTTNAGKSVCDFSVAVDKRFKPNDGSPTADFFRVSCWEKTAEFVANYLGKGRMVAVSGRLQSRKYTASDGTNREVVEIIAESVSALDRPKDDDQGQGRTADRGYGGGGSAPAADEYDPFADE